MLILTVFSIFCFKQNIKMYKCELLSLFEVADFYGFHFGSNLYQKKVCHVIAILHCVPGIVAFTK